MNDTLSGFPYTYNVYIRDRHFDIWFVIRCTLHFHAIIFICVCIAHHDFNRIYSDIWYMVICTNAMAQFSMPTSHCIQLLNFNSLMYTWMWFIVCQLVRQTTMEQFLSSLDVHIIIACPLFYQKIASDDFCVDDFFPNLKM